jgi:hypothetical protein
MGFAREAGMTMSTQLKQYAGHRLRRRLLRTIPWLGGVVALVALGGTIRRKGVLGGTLDTALDMIPFIGGAKNLTEVSRGRDFIRDKGDHGRGAVMKNREKIATASGR